MSMLSKSFVMLLALVSPLALAQAEQFTGIWRDDAQPDSYYSLHIDGDEVVFIALTMIERTGETLAGSYRGRITTNARGATLASVEVLQRHPDSPMSAEIFASAPDKLYIYWCNQPANTCVVGFRTHVTKVF